MVSDGEHFFMYLLAIRLYVGLFLEVYSGQLFGRVWEDLALII